MRRPLDLPDALDDKLKTLARRKDLSAGYLLARIIEAEIERQYTELLEADSNPVPSGAQPA